MSSFRLGHVLAAPYSGGTLIATCFCWAGVTLYFFRRYSLSVWGRAGGHSHSARVQNCCNWLVMRLAWAERRANGG